MLINICWNSGIWHRHSLQTICTCDSWSLLITILILLAGIGDIGIPIESNALINKMTKIAHLLSKIILYLHRIATLFNSGLDFLLILKVCLECIFKFLIHSLLSCLLARLLASLFAGASSRIWRWTSAWIAFLARAAKAEKFAEHY